MKVKQEARLRELRLVLKDAGRIKKREIDRQVASALGCQPEDIRKSLYRDLHDLEARGELAKITFSRAGEQIPGKEKKGQNASTEDEWIWQGLAEEIKGAGYLKMIGGQLLASPQIERLLEFSLSSPPDNEKFHWLEFETPSQTVILQILKLDCPLTLILGRASAGIEPNTILESAQKIYKSRAAVLLLKDKLLSGFSKSLGHCAVELKGKGGAIIIDSGSSNGTLVYTNGGAVADSASAQVEDIGMTMDQNAFLKRGLATGCKHIKADRITVDLPFIFEPTLSLKVHVK